VNCKAIPFSEAGGVTVWTLDVAPDGHDADMEAGFAYALTDDQLVLGTSRATVEALLAVHRGDGDSLADRDDVSDLAARLPAERAGMMTVDVAALMASMRDQVGATDTQLRDLLDQQLASLPDVVAARIEVAERLSEGRDWLLEWNSRRPEISTPIIDGIRGLDEDLTLEAFMLAVFDLHFVEVEDIAPRTWRLASAGTFRDLLPGITSEGVTVTRDRQRALAREDIQFLTWDHPLVTGALDRLLGSEHGNCSAARATGTTPGLLVEAVYVLECVAPPDLHVDRFLPSVPLRVILDHRGDVPNRLPLARMGKAYCMVDATDVPVAVGDLLTTSSIPGHAMKVTDPLRSFGTVIGKALQPLSAGRGLVPVLVRLQ